MEKYVTSVAGLNHRVGRPGVSGNHNDSIRRLHAVSEGSGPGAVRNSKGPYRQIGVGEDDPCFYLLSRRRIDPVGETLVRGHSTRSPNLPILGPGLLEVGQHCLNAGRPKETE